MSTYPRESVEFIPVVVTVNGVVVTAAVEFALVIDGDRPVTWTAATSLSGSIGVIKPVCEPGQWNIWARVTASPETPVINCGFITVT